jgi:hypothetical protein
MSDKRFSSVVGNHDLALVRYWRNETAFLKNAQKQTFRELENDGDQLLNYLASLPTFIDLDTHVVVHAGLRPGVPISLQSPEDLTELRTLGADRTSRKGVPWYEVYDDNKVALFGHWPAPEPRRGKSAIGLDTGCVYGYRLTAYIIESERFVSVQAHDTHDGSNATSTN